MKRRSLLRRALAALGMGMGVKVEAVDPRDRAPIKAVLDGKCPYEELFGLYPIMDAHGQRELMRRSLQMVDVDAVNRIFPRLEGGEA